VSAASTHSRRSASGAGPVARAGAGGPAPEIEVRGLRKRYGRRDALRDVDLTVERGGFLTVFGPNGAGKTTLLRVLAGLASASGGTVTVAGADVREDPTPVRRAVGFISHNALLYPDLTAYENLRFYADMYGVGEADGKDRTGRTARRDARIAELLERVELSVRRDDTVRTFSRGMRQRLSIARAILHRPLVLLLDEPHAGLDARAVGILDGLLAEIRADHTFVLVTHSPEVGLAPATQALVLAGGRVVFRAAGAELRSESVGESVRAALGGAAMPPTAPPSAKPSATGGGLGAPPGGGR
jgi:heme exporter protein A